MCPGQEKGLNGPKFQTEKVSGLSPKPQRMTGRWVYLLSSIPQDIPLSLRMLPLLAYHTSFCLSLPLCNTISSSQGALRPRGWLPACSNPEKCDL